MTAATGEFPMTLLANTCPHCGYEHTAASNTSGEGGPAPGDVTLCIECGEWSVFDAALAMREPTDDEQIEIGLDAGARRVREASVRATSGGEP